MLLDPDKVIDFFCTCPERQVVFYFLYLAWLHYVYERTDLNRLFSQSFPLRFLINLSSRTGLQK